MQGTRKKGKDGKKDEDGKQRAEDSLEPRWIFKEERINVKQRAAPLAPTEIDLQASRLAQLATAPLAVRLAGWPTPSERR